MVNIPICPSRQELQKYFTDARSLLAFEQLFDFSRVIYDATIDSAKASYIFSTPVNTPIAILGNFYKANGTATHQNLNKFTQNANNSVVCNNTLSFNYMVNAVVSTNGTNGDDIVVRIQKYNAKNAVYEIVATSIQQKINSMIGVNGIVSLAINDRIELWLTNNTNTNGVTITQNSQVLVYQI